MGTLQCDPHVLQGTRPGTREMVETHQDVVDEIGRPANGKEDHDGHEHLDDLSSDPMVRLDTL